MKTIVVNMSNRMRLAVLLAILAGLVYTASAAAADNVRLVGQLTKIDGKALTITSTVDGKSKDTVVTCNDATKYRRDEGNKWVKFSDLEVGQTLRVYYGKDDNVAALVNIAKPGSK